MWEGLVRRRGCITGKGPPLPSRNVAGYLLNPSDLLLLLSVAAPVENRVEGEPVH